MTGTELRIEPFSPVHQSEARALILEGLGEHWGWIDEVINDDLLDIAQSYSKGCFVLGWLGTELVATGALVPEETGVMRIVRMSVRKDFRRQGIGTQVLRHLVQLARDTGAGKVVLETDETWQDAIGLYRSFGFVETGRGRGDIHMALDLDTA